MPVPLTVSTAGSGLSELSERAERAEWAVSGREGGGHFSLARSLPPSQSVSQSLTQCHSVSLSEPTNELSDLAKSFVHFEECTLAYTPLS